MTNRQSSLKSLFESVFWPAAAGNVFWSACSLLVDTQVSLTSVDGASRLAVLFVLSIYLSVEWLRNYQTFPANVGAKFFIADWIHVCAVVFVALTAAIRTEWLPFAAAVYFAATALGHFFGAWEAAEAIAMDRVLLGSVNALGVLVLWLGRSAQSYTIWYVPLAFVLVVGLWLAYRWVAIKALFRQ